MGKKRSSKDVDQSNTQSKKGKVSETTEFNGTAFKAMLRDPTKAMKGLNTFISIAKKLPCPELYDVVEGYIKISMECSEIFKLLEGDAPIESEMILIFQSLEMILLRTASDLSHFRVVGTNIVKKTVSSYMKLIQTSLSSETHRFVRQCLNFLSAMVSQGAEMASEVFSHFHFTKSHSKLARGKYKMGNPDIRMAYIQFALSFLVSGDNATIGQLLEMEEFLPDILSNGLKEDRLSIVNLILSTLKTKVVRNQALSKTQKVRFFTPFLLARLASLYSWNGIVDASTEDSTMANDAGKVIVRKLVHNFLLDLCCSRRHGLSFFDPSFGTAGRAGNIVLLQFVVGLKQATEDELVSDLVVNILRANPDILHRFFKETPYSFTPREMSAWTDNITLLRKIYEAQPKVSKAFQTRAVVPLPRLLTMVMVTSLPPVCNKAFFSQGLSVSNYVVQQKTLSLMLFFLKRAQSNVEFCLNHSVWMSSDVYTPASMEEFVQLYGEALSKVLPDMTCIVSKWQSLNKEKVEDDGKKTKGGDVKQASKVEKVPDPDSAVVIVLKALILQVICLYQKVVPHLVTQSTFDFSKLLKGIISEKGMRQEVPPVLQHQILQVSLELPANKFSWFSVQDHVNAKDVSREKTVFFQLLKMFVSCSNTQLKISTRKLVLKVLKDSGVFEYTWAELELWLDHLAQLDPGHQDAVIEFLERVLARLVSQPYTYTDQVASQVQEAAYLQASLSGQEGDAVSIPISHIDDVLDMVDVIMEGSEGEMQELGQALSEDLVLQTFPFSPLVPAILEARNKLPAVYRTEKGVVYEYIAAVLCDVLHCQRDPLPLSLTLLHYDKDLSSSEGTAHSSVLLLHQYYSKWLPQQTQEQLFQSCKISGDISPNLDSFTGLLKAAYTQGSSGLLEGSFSQRVDESMAAMELHEYPVAAKQILLYIKTTVDNFSTLSKNKGPSMLAVLMRLLQGLVVRMQTCQVVPNPAVTEPMVQEETETMVQEETETMVLGETETTGMDTKEVSEPKTVVQGTTLLAKLGEPAKSLDPLKESDLFLDVNASSEAEDNKDLVVVSVLDSILKHPCLEQWFLSLELSSVPPNTLNPVRLKQVCAQLTDAILVLLRTAAPLVQSLDSMHLLCPYLEAAGRALLRELEEGRGRGGEESRAVAALLVLHAYMDPSLLQGLVSSLLLLPQETLLLPGDGSRVGAASGVAELNAYGRAALQVLTEAASSPLLLNLLSQAHLQGLATLLLSCSSPALEAFLLQALTRRPCDASLLHSDVLLHCLMGPPTVSSAGLGAAMLASCPTHRLCFEAWCLQPGHLEMVTDQMEAFLPLVQSYLRTATRHDAARPKEVQKVVIKALKQALLPRLSLFVLGEDTVDPPGAVEALSSLLRQAAKVKDVTALRNALPTVLQKPDSFERWQLVEPITAVLSVCPEELQAWRSSVLTASLQWLVSSFSRNRQQSPELLCQEETMLKRLTDVPNLPEDITAAEWNSFVKAGLKYRYRDPNFLITLNILLDQLYVGGVGPKDVLPLSTVHMMASSHSLFLPTMLGTEGDLQGQRLAKEALVSLLINLVKKCPAVCNSSHLVVLLGAYGATLSTTDQKLLLLLQEYEQNNVSLVDFKCLLWGPAAVEHHKARKSQGVSLWQQPSSEEVLALLCSDTMANTVKHFPLQRRIIIQEGKDLIFKDEELKDHGCLYDPCFLLPLFSAMLQPESVMDCLKFVSNHSLGVVVVSLSSYDNKLRAAAYQVLASFYQHLDAARFHGSRQLLYLLDMVKNGIIMQNVRVPFILTTYIAKVAQQMLRPEEHMYVIVNRFLLSHQFLDIRRVPDFFKLFYSCDMEHKLERQWIMSILEESLTDQACYELLDQHRIFQSLLGFCCSPLSDIHTQIQILRVLQRAGHVTKAVYHMTKHHAILPWIMQLLEKRHVDQQLLSAVLELLHNLWFTNLGRKDTQHGGSSSLTSDDQPQGGSTPKVLPLPLIGEFLCAATAVIRHLRLVKAEQLSLYLQMLCSILQHRGTALGVYRMANWLTLRPQALSCTEVLALLHRWGTLTHTAPLLSQLQAVAEKHRIKELMGSGREKGRTGKVFSQRGPRPGEEWEEERLQEEDKAQLEVCTPHLRNILTYWEPNSPPSDNAPLDNSMAHLLTRWSLKSLVEDTSNYEDKETNCFLRWFQKAVLPHKEMVDMVLADPAVRLDLLCVYHRACEPLELGQPQRPSSFRVEHLQLFTSIMTQLLEVRGCPNNDLHRAVLTACSIETSCDHPDTKEVGLILLSLYIHDIWSGTKSPTLLLNHARLVTRTNGPMRRKSKCAQKDTPLRDICCNLLMELPSPGES
ncbi:hypothetical protein UPYG_G00194060 [Umbra pygmaea]|uniref:Nucleolar pre-ribosomal-associated protein 1 n=1 Tax=Umbra pygmaea TaxID=75934 RepID=A0ABD0WLT9_UMBPY